MNIETREKIKNGIKERWGNECEVERYSMHWEVDGGVDPDAISQICAEIEKEIANPFRDKGGKSPELDNDGEELPEIELGRPFLSAREELDPYLIDGLLREGSKMSISSQSKLFKTWIMIDMAFCIGSGQPWLGHECNRAPVLYVNFELKHNTMNNRALDICEKKKINPVNGHDVDFWNLRGKSSDVKKMIDRILERIRDRFYEFVIIDPAYKMLGELDENSATDITFFCNQVERICCDVHASSLIVGHATKGDQSGKHSNDIQSGSGVWARDPDVVASFLKCEDSAITSKYGDDCIDIRFSGMREDVTPHPFAARWEFPLYHRISGIIPKKGAANKSIWEPRDIFSILQTGPKTHGDWMKAAEMGGITKTPFNKLLKKCRDKQVQLDLETGLYSLTPEGAKALISAV